MVVQYSEQKSFKIAEFRLSWTELPVLEGSMSELAVIKFLWPSKTKSSIHIPGEGLLQASSAAAS